jgi:hypothetical protein
MRYVISEQCGTVYWKEEGEVCFAPMSQDNTFNTEEGGQVETWEEVDPSEKERVLNLLG